MSFSWHNVTILLLSTSIFIFLSPLFLFIFCYLFSIYHILPSYSLTLLSTLHLLFLSSSLSLLSSHLPPSPDLRNGCIHWENHWRSSISLSPSIPEEEVMSDPWELVLRSIRSPSLQERDFGKRRNSLPKRLDTWPKHALPISPSSPPNSYQYVWSSGVTFLKSCYCQFPFRFKLNKMKVSSCHLFFIPLFN